MCRHVTVVAHHCNLELRMQEENICNAKKVIEATADASELAGNQYLLAALRLCDRECLFQICSVLIMQREQALGNRLSIGNRYKWPFNTNRV